MTVRIAPVAVSVIPPVVPAIENTLSVVSLLVPSQRSVAELPAEPIEIVPFVPSELFAPELPIDVTERLPCWIVTPPLKLLAALESVTVPVPDFTTDVAPLLSGMVPCSVRLPAPPSVSVLAPLPVATRLLESVSAAPVRA